MRRWAPSLLFVSATLACGPLGDGAKHAENSEVEHAHKAPPPPVAETEHPENIANYTMNVAVDPVTHSLHGTGTIQWKNSSAKETSELWVHLYLNAFKNQRSFFLREPIGQFRGNQTPSTWGTIDVRKFILHDGENNVALWQNAELHRVDDEDETDVRVPLPRAIASGETIAIEMEWDAQLPSIVERVGFEGSFHFVGQWFPKIARRDDNGTWAHFPFHRLAEFYADFGTYDVTIDVPEAFTIGATGPVVDSKVANGRRIEHHVQSDVHDFAFTTWDKWHANKASIDGVELSILYPPGYDAVAAREVDAMRFALPYFQRKYGAYPYKVLTLVHPPETAREAGGMEYPTLITTGGPWYTPAAIRSAELVTIHEFGHQYFYGIFASNENAWPFLDEGMNSYAEQDALRAYKGAGNVVDLFGLRIADGELASVMSRDPNHETRVAQPAESFNTGRQYGGLVYARTAALFETVARVFGDETMQKGIAAYRKRARFRHPTPEDLIASFEEADAKLAPFLQRALFEKGWIDYAVLSVSSKATRVAGGIFDREGKRETVTGAASSDHLYDGSVLIVRRGTLTLPVEVDLIFTDDTRERRYVTGTEESTRLSYRGDKELKGVIIDPDHRILIDDVPENNGGLAKKAPPFARVAERLLYWGELLVQAVGP